MSVEVVMPQMGESITEGTVSKWLKKVGDKIDAEVPSPGAGTLLEIRHQEGETVEVGTVLATIGADGEAPVASIQQSSVSAKPAEPVAPAASAPEKEIEPIPSP